VVLEVGNLVATKRGASQVLFLLFAAMLEASGAEWLVCTATPGVQKTIRRLGFDFHVLGDADPSLLAPPANSIDWGSYYESRPQVVAGNLSEAMAVLSGRKIYSSLISYYQNHISALAATIKDENSSYGMQSLTG
jgi:hypothetical protein